MTITFMTIIGILLIGFTHKTSFSQAIVNSTKVLHAYWLFVCGGRRRLGTYSGGYAMKRSLYIFSLIIFFTVRSATAQSSVLDAGARFQKTTNLYYENGVALSYSNKHLLPDKLYFGFTYVSSRLGTAINSNAIKQDNYLLSAGWYFRRSHIVRPFVRVNGGYFAADYGDKIFAALPQNSLLLSTDAGISFQTHTPLKIATSLGYNLITGNGLSGPGTLYPVFYQITLSWNIFNHKK
jgi:hypothetical protein